VRGAPARSTTPRWRLGAVGGAAARAPRAVVWLLAVSGLFACQDRASAARGAPAASTVAPSASAAALPPAPSAKTLQLAGTYRVAKGVIEMTAADGRLPAWDQDDGQQGVGAGELTVDVAADGAARGSATGVLGDLAVHGALDGDTLRLTLAPAVPSAGAAFAGVVVASRQGEGYRGDVRVASGDSRWIRQGSIELAPRRAR
jgi:hypothetical protein